LVCRGQDFSRGHACLASTHDFAAQDDLPLARGRSWLRAILLLLPFEQGLLLIELLLLLKLLLDLEAARSHLVRILVHLQVPFAVGSCERSD